MYISLFLPPAILSLLSWSRFYSFLFYFTLSSFLLSLCISLSQTQYSSYSFRFSLFISRALFCPSPSLLFSLYLFIFFYLSVHCLSPPSLYLSLNLTLYLSFFLSLTLQLYHSLGRSVQNNYEARMLNVAMI